MFSEIIVPIICALLAVVASVYSAHCAWKASSSSSRAQKEETVLREFLKRRSEAFEKVLQIDIDIYDKEDIVQCVVELTRAIHVAVLYSSEETAAKLLAYLASAASPERKLYSEARVDALKAMRRDLLTYSMPVVEDPDVKATSRRNK